MESFEYRRKHHLKFQKQKVTLTKAVKKERKSNFKKQSLVILKPEDATNLNFQTDSNLLIVNRESGSLKT
jgi:hypothetical protein